MTTVDAWALTVPVDHVIAGFRIRYSDHLLLRARGGWGASPLYARSHHQVPPVLDGHVRPLLRAHAGASPPELRALAQEALEPWPDVLCALDLALWDAEAREAGRSVASLLDGAPDDRVPVTEQLFAMEPGRAAQASRALVRDHGSSRLKVKVLGEPGRDVALVAAVREAVGDGVPLRLDANRGYALAEAAAVAERYRELGVVAWEEPAAASFAELRELRRETGLPVTLDESLRSFADLERALEAEALDTVNLKLPRIGGLTAAQRWRAACAERGVGVSIGCNEELGPGMWALLHAAAAWRPSETEGVGWMRLGLDFDGPRPVIEGGTVALEAGPGWGAPTAPRIVALGGERRRAPRAVPEAEWGRGFVARSHLRRQRQRAENARLRATRWVRARRAAA